MLCDSLAKTLGVKERRPQTNRVKCDDGVQQVNWTEKSAHSHKATAVGVGALMLTGLEYKPSTRQQYMAVGCVTSTQLEYQPHKPTVVGVWA